MEYLRRGFGAFESLCGYQDRAVPTGEESAVQYGGDPNAAGNPQGLRTSVLLVNQLPEELALKIGSKNAQHVYHFASAK